VSDEVIVDDYALSAIGTRRLMQALREEYADAVEEVEKYATAILRVLPEAMAGFIADVRSEYGGFAGLVGELGITDEMASLKAAVVEPA
jgi:hypothetical protein